MIDLNLISIVLLTILLILILTLGFLDNRQKRTLHGKPQVSFLIPCYNDGASVRQTIESIYTCYDPQRFELLVVNDKSTDDSLAVLKQLRKQYRFTLVTNRKNKGKARSLNELSKRAKHNILFIVDADIIMNRRAVTDVLARLQQPGVVAVSAPYRPLNKGVLPSLQAVEYHMLTFIQIAHNRSSTMSISGGCFAVRRAAFEEVGGLSENAIVEDMDLALKLREAGHKVQQSIYEVPSIVPDTMTWWYHQKIRWTSGSVQNIIKHFRTWIKNPLTLIFLLLFSSLSFIATLSLLRQLVVLDTLYGTIHLLSATTVSLFTLKTIGLYYGAILFRNLLVNLSFSAFSLPYTIPLIARLRDVYKLLFAIPYALIYMPILSIIATIGLVKGVIRYRALQRGARAW